MTFEEKMKAMLVERGLFDEQADVVIQNAKEKIGDSMAHRWREDSEGYPPSVIAVLWISVKNEAKDYIAENLPKALFRPMFES